MSPKRFIVSAQCLFLLGFTFLVAGCNLTALTKQPATNATERQQLAATFSEHLSREELVVLNNNLTTVLDEQSDNKGKLLQFNQAVLTIIPTNTQWKASELKRHVPRVINTDLPLLLDGQYYHISKTINVRAHPKPNAPKINLIRPGDTVVALAEHMDSPWLLIENQGVVMGYVYKPLLGKPNVDPPLLDANVPAALTVLANTQNEEKQVLLMYPCRDISYAIQSSWINKSGEFTACQSRSGMWFVEHRN